MTGSRSSEGLSKWEVTWTKLGTRFIAHAVWGTSALAAAGVRKHPLLSGRVDVCSVLGPSLQEGH